jgi:hypothetical protein
MTKPQMFFPYLLVRRFDKNFLFLALYFSSNCRLNIATIFKPHKNKENWMNRYARLKKAVCLLLNLLQLNKYETAPYFLQLNQNMTSGCLFTFVFSPKFT